MALLNLNINNYCSDFIPRFPTAALCRVKPGYKKNCGVTLC